MIAHDPMLVILSITIAVLGAFTACVVTSNIGALSPSERRVRIVMAVVTLGGSIWTMQFVGLLAIDVPLNFALNPELTALSAVTAFGGTALALFLFWSKGEETSARLPAASTILGAAIAGTNDSAIAAIAGRGLQVSWFLTAIAVAVSIQAASMVLSFLSWQRGVLVTLGGAIVLGVSLASTHYLAIASTYGLERTLLAVHQDTGAISERHLAWAATIMMYLICSICLSVFVIMQFREEIE